MDTQALPERRRWWWSLDTVRIRVTLSAALTFTFAVAFASLLLVTLIRSEITGRLSNEAVAAASEISAQLDDPEPGLLSWHPESVISFRAVTDNDEISGDARARKYAAAMNPPKTSDHTMVVTTGPDGRTATALAVLDDDSGRSVEVTATSRADDLPSGILVALLRFAVPGLIIVVTAVTWHIVGRALDRVAQVRAAAAEIAANPGERLPVPRGHDELTDLVMTLNGMLDELEASAERQRGFISDAGHELRTPITVLRALCETPDGDPEKLSQIRAAALRLSLLVEDLFTLAKLDEWGVPEQSDVDLDAAVDDAIAETAAAAKQRGVRFVTADVEPVRCVGDPVALSRAVTNLVANAVRHAASTVTITCRTDTDGSAVLVVDDDGAGIAPGDRGRVFERFSRLDEGRARDAGGSGLGLAIVDEVVRAHGGTTSCADSPSGGARFVVTIPANQPANRQAGV